MHCLWPSNHNSAADALSLAIQMGLALAVLRMHDTVGSVAFAGADLFDPVDAFASAGMEEQRPWSGPIKMCVDEQPAQQPPQALRLGSSSLDQHMADVTNVYHERMQRLADSFLRDDDPADGAPKQQQHRQ
jgi:hypothetical protein